MPYNSSGMAFSISLWRCPLCLGGRFSPVIVKNLRGEPYKTEFYECDRCSVMFRYPDKYARLGIPIKRFNGDIGPKTLAEAHYFWREALEKKD